MKIFYSWQSDLENKHNRGFIKDVLKNAIKGLNTDLEVSDSDRKIELDHDTMNVPGTPDLAGTIFEKISSSTVFIADISFVAERKDDSGNVKRKVANPNVLIELGYALSTLGSDRVICVLNTASGSVEDLPFDLKHKRHPIQYHHNDETDKTEQKNRLTKSLEAAIKSIVDLEKYKSREFILSPCPSRAEIMQAIMASDSKDDWEKTSFEWNEIIYYKKNVNLRFEMNFTEEGTQRDDFKEPWANCHPDPNATGYWFNLYYGSTNISTYILVSVDGGRAMLPVPQNSKKMAVKPLFYKVAQIHDALGTLDEYMIRSGLRLEDVDLDSGLGDGSGFGAGAGKGNGDGSGNG